MNLQHNYEFRVAQVFLREKAVEIRKQVSSLPPPKKPLKTPCHLPLNLKKPLEFKR